MSREDKTQDYETPVTTKCIPAAPGTKAIVKAETGEETVGPEVVAWTIGIRQNKHGDIWPTGTWVEAITFNPDANIIGVVHPDGTVDYGDGQTFASVADWMSEKAPG